MMKNVIKVLLIPALLVVAGLPANAKENDGTVRGNGCCYETTTGNYCGKGGEEPQVPRVPAAPSWQPRTRSGAPARSPTARCYPRHSVTPQSHPALVASLTGPAADNAEPAQLGAASFYQMSRWPHK